CRETCLCSVGPRCTAVKKMKAVNPGSGIHGLGGRGVDLSHRWTVRSPRGVRKGGVGGRAVGKTANGTESVACMAQRHLLVRDRGPAGSEHGQAMADSSLDEIVRDDVHVSCPPHYVKVVDVRPRPMSDVVVVLKATAEHITTCPRTWQP